LYKIFFKNSSFFIKKAGKTGFFGFFGLQLRSAVRAARCFDRNTTMTKNAGFFCGVSYRSLLKFIGLPDYIKYGKCNNQKINDALDELAIPNTCRTYG
jgi:hypothetical protein